MDGQSFFFDSAQLGDKSAEPVSNLALLLFVVDDFRDDAFEMRGGLG